MEDMECKLDFVGSSTEDWLKYLVGEIDQSQDKMFDMHDICNIWLIFHDAWYILRDKWMVSIREKHFCMVVDFNFCDLW